MTRFTEIDGWWSIEIPSGWQATRVELDGTRTRLDNWQRSPAPTATPSRDKQSTSVYYEFQATSEHSECTSCPGVADARLVVAARAATDVRVLANSIADDLRRAPDLTSLSVGAAPCAQATCPVINYSTPALSVRTLIQTAESQRRTYEVRASAIPDHWSQVGPALQRSQESFAPGSRGA